MCGDEKISNIKCVCGGEITSEKTLMFSYKHPEKPREMISIGCSDKRCVFHIHQGGFPNCEADNFNQCIGRYYKNYEKIRDRWKTWLLYTVNEILDREFGSGNGLPYDDYVVECIHKSLVYDGFFIEMKEDDAEDYY